MAELNLTITVPDDKAQEILTDFVTFHGYDGEGTKVAYMKKSIIHFLRDSVKTYRARKAAGEATNIDEIEMS